MKFGSFSDAIRAGIDLVPTQAFGWSGDSFSACVLWTGRRAIGLNEGDLVDLYPDLLTVTQCPECEFTAPLKDRDFGEMGVLVHLNDDHQWSRERIAAWLQAEEDKRGYVTITESVEPKSLPPALVTVGVNG